MTTIIHLVDDTTPGGVMRVIEHVQSAAGLGHLGRHSVVMIPKTGRGPTRIHGDVIVSHLTMNWRRLPWLIQLRAAHATTPMVHVEHSYTAGFLRHNVPHPARFMTMVRVAFSLFDRVVPVSDTQAYWVLDKGLADPSQITTIPSAVDVSLFDSIPSATGPIKVIGAFGRLEPQKGFDVLIRAMRASPRQDLQLHIFGQGSEREALTSLAGADPRICFGGFVPEPAKAMASVDAVAMPSRWEAYGLVALEARAAGRMLLASPLDGLNDHIAAGAHPVRDNSVRGWSETLTALDRPDIAKLDRARSDANAASARFAQSWTLLLHDLLAPEDKAQAA
ncbi:glycosyltransferase family 4 protein [Maritimibacter dapengensis]|uniref:Glycosyltransferase family 4 protein n=1 Tax=Maritimibacter dapengensis TaxID=2836868 RepID=A0ABS6T3N4_9RHOB|nr:glycosyltransferase family 4 protein [Maritimibacter dapengensis]MBV7379838.1 glycosyltransferase family 4 protein [Maritimibacter dapengensis]